MFCVRCGAQVDNDSKFCPACGAPQIVEADVSAEQKQQQASAYQQQAPVYRQQQPGTSKSPKQGGSSTGSKKTMWIVLAIVCAILAIVLGGLCALILPKVLNKDSETEESSRIEGQDDDGSDSEGSGSDGTGEEGTNDSTDVVEVTLLDEGTLEGQLQRQIMDMNADGYSLQSIDVYADNYAAGAKNTAATWSDEVFYTLEGYKTHGMYFNKNQCTLVKKELLNAQTGNRMEYEIYLNPNSGVGNKIVSIEYLASGIEVTEYYYTEAQKISFIFQYTTDNYVSTYATPDKAGQRFLFAEDCLVNWRQIASGTTLNYCVGANEAARLSQAWAASTIKQYAQLDEATRGQFDTVEQKMIDAAYNTYNTVMNAASIARIQGYVYDENSNPLPDATVNLYANDFTSCMYSSTTSDDGSYMIYVPAQEYSYNMSVSMDGRNTCDIYQVDVNNEQISAYQDSVYMFSTSGTDAEVYLTLGDAFNYNASGNGMMRLPNADVKVRRGLNNRYGEVCYEGITDSDGYIVLTLAPFVYTIEVSAAGYETMYYTIIANPLLENIYEFYAAPTLNDGEYAIVLSWGLTPYDLDSHLFTTRGTSTDHIWYGDTYDDFNNYLDVDDTDSYGPETVTIRSFTASDYYKYCVVDYSDCVTGNYSSYALSLSGATVNVYSSDGLIGTFHVPTNTPGVIWEVFEIRNGQLTPIQRYYDDVTNKSWWHNE